MVGEVFVSERESCVHTGEIDLMGDDLGGLAATIAARVMAEAADNEVSVSRTAKDLVLGSVSDSFDCGTYDLKGGSDE